MAKAKAKAQNKEKPVPNTAAKEIQSGEAAFKTIENRLERIRDADIVSPNLDVQAAAVVALGGATRLKDSNARKKILALAKVGVIDLALIDDLPAVAWATWYVRHRLLQASATHSEAALPISLVEEAQSVRRRMLRVLDYHLDGDEEGMTLLAKIRSGSGYLDLADDLMALADRYAMYKAILAGDKKSYRKADEKLARDLAKKIIDELGTVVTPDEQRWKDLQARAFTLLLPHYDETMRVGRFLFHKQGGEKLFPSLYSAVRSAPSGGAAKAPADAPAIETSSSQTLSEESSPES